MQGFLIKRRGHASAEESVDGSSVGKQVAAAFAAVFFGSLFLFLELYGKCHCSLDLVGAGLLASGSAVLSYFCLKDLMLSGTEDEETQEEGDGDSSSSWPAFVHSSRESGESRAPLLSTSTTPSATLIPDSNNNASDIFKPLLLSPEVSAENRETLQLPVGQEVAFLATEAPLDPRIRATRYNLPFVVVQT